MAEAAKKLSKTQAIALLIGKEREAEKLAKKLEVTTFRLEDLTTQLVRQNRLRAASCSSNVPSRPHSLMLTHSRLCGLVLHSVLLLLPVHHSLLPH